MRSIAINLVRYNQPEEMIAECLAAALSQDYPNFTVTLTENGSGDSIKDGILKRFSIDLRFSYVDNRANLGFAGAHNKFFQNSEAELVMPLNPDAIMQPGFITALEKAFDDAVVGAAEGKMLKPTPGSNGEHILDGTGIIVSRTRRAQERGQLQEDMGQYDSHTHIFGVSGTVPLYRRSALEAVKHFSNEYFDEDFFMYWEDFDLSWRLRLAGFACVYVPGAVVLHERVAGQTKHGYRKPLAFAKHHAKLSPRIRRFNWRNHIFAIIKNDFGYSLWRDLPFIITREIAMLGYITIFEPKTFGAVPSFFRLLPKMLEKRKMISKTRTVSSQQIGKWFLGDSK